MRTLYFILTLIMISMAGIQSAAQISQGGTPPGINFNFTDTADELHSLPAPDMAKIMVEDIENERNAIGLPQRMGVAVPARLNTQNAGLWHNLEDGSKLWRLRIRVKDALALGVYYDAFYLPEGGRLFLYNKDRNQILGAFTNENNPETGLFANEFVQGDEVIIEYHQPKQVTEEAVIHISELAYAYRHIRFEWRETEGTGSLWCMINVACSEGDDWQDQIRSVARISIKIGFNYYWCSGSLINNTENDREPYFLTAAHCGGNASSNDLNQWVFYFNYQASTCTGSSSSWNSLTGCQLKARDPSQGNDGSDFYLVKLNNNVPDSYNVYYSGWNRSLSTADMGNGVSIHHPAGGIKKISTYTDRLASSISWNGLPSHWRVNWAETENGLSIVQGGSSGSPIFDSNGLIVGDLTGGYDYNSCETPSPAFYGKIWYAWDMNGTTAATRLKDWLDPNDSGIMKLQGVNWEVQPPIADFEADQATIEQGQQVNFTDLSQPAIQSWEWVFEGGIPETSDERDPGPILYTETGSYQVSLIVTNADGTDIEIKSDYITVEQASPPVAEFTASETEIITGATINFQDLSEGNPFAWQWVFEGGSPGTSSLQNPTVRFNNPGTYTVSLTATNYGGADTEIKEDYIVVIEANFPEADFEASQTQIYNGSTVDFTDLSSGEPHAWFWEFEGGMPPTSEAQHPQNIEYPNAGSFAVSLTVANAFGQHTKTVEDYIQVDLLGLDHHPEKEFEVYPNPTNGLFYLELPESEQEKYTMRLYKTNGRLVRAFTHEWHQSPVAIDLRNESGGIYMLLIQGVEKQFYYRIQYIKP